MATIKTILLDADGVLIQGNMASQYFEETYGITRETTIGFYRGPFLDCLLGKQDLYDLLPQYLKKWGWQKSTEAFVQEWFDYENKLDTDLVGFVQGLRSMGIKCYVVTNQEKHRAKYMLEKMGFSDSFDALFASAHLGSKKPDIQFFSKVLQKLSIVDKSSVVFWDDTLENVTAAKEFGINSELYTNFDKFREVLEGKFKIKGNSSHYAARD